MRGPRLPGWIVYPWLAVTLLFVAYARREHFDAPAPPPPLSAKEGAALAETSPIDPAILMRVRPKAGPNLGVAFSAGDGGVWLTAAAALGGCARPAVMVNDTEGVAARSLGGGAAVTVLTTPRGAPALPIAAAPPSPGEVAYAPGFPQRRPGELALRYLGRRTLRLVDRERRAAPVMVWAELGRTEGLKGALDGLVGAPVIDGEGRVLAVVLGEAPRRGLVLTTPYEALGAALAAARLPRPAQAAGAVVTPENYGLAADDLRRALRVAPVACIRG